MSVLVSEAPPEVAIVRGEIRSHNSKTFFVMDLYTATTEKYLELTSPAPAEVLLTEGKRIKVRGHLMSFQLCDLNIRFQRALEYIHSKGWVHMDVKPANLFFDASGWYLADFGSALPEYVQEMRTPFYEKF